MNDGIDRLLNSILSPIVSTVREDSYNGPETTYIVYTYEENPSGFGDDTAGAIVYPAVIHLYMPVGVNYDSTKKAIKKALTDAGFTYPSIMHNGDGDKQELVFETEISL